MHMLPVILCHPLLQDEDNLREALRYSAALLGELRTSLLSPQKYYELYMQASDELQNLQVRESAACRRAAWSHGGIWGQVEINMCWSQE